MRNNCSTAKHFRVIFYGRERGNLCDCYKFNEHKPLRYSSMVVEYKVGENKTIVECVYCDATWDA
jgi:hypothetical protein